MTPRTPKPEPLQAEPMQETALATIDTRQADPDARAVVLMPAIHVEQAVARYNQLVGFVKQMLHEKIDFGVIPGTAKPTLLQPGAEKLCMFFGLRAEFLTLTELLDWDRGIFYFQYKCRLWRGDFLVGEGIGSCNSREKKYRYRNSERVCPACGKATIIKGKVEFGGGWLCYAKKGGCGAKFHERAPEIIDQEVGQIENPEPFEVINTLQKMGQKRAFMGATIRSVNASEFFTQDIEDMDPQDLGHDTPIQERKKAPESRPATASGAGAALAIQSAPRGQQTACSAKPAGDGWYAGVVFSIIEKGGGGAGSGAWKRYAVTIDGNEYSAMIDEKNASLLVDLQSAMSGTDKIEFEIKSNTSKGKTYVNLIDMRRPKNSGPNVAKNYGEPKLQGEMAGVSRAQADDPEAYLPL